MASIHRTEPALAFLAALALLAGASAVLLASTRGPDAGGYIATDETVYSFTDISGPGGGTGVLAGTDDGTALLALPFPFTFYGAPRSFICVSSNGAAYFVADPGGCAGFEADFANTDLSAAPVPHDRPALLPFWTDLTFQVPGSGAVLYQTLGTAPARRFVIQWHRAFPQGSANPVTFQLVLSENGQTARFQYSSVSLGAGAAAAKGGLATIGIRDAGSPANGRFLQWSYNAPVLEDSSALHFSLGDTTPPAITATATPAQLWPPNGGTVHVSVSGSMTDTGSGIDPATARFAVHDEYGQVQPAGAVAVGAGGTYTVSVPLVASRQGTDKDGRIYTIEVSVSDRAGNQASTTTLVVVPHDRR